MKNLLIIGAGGVSRVATVKCAINSDTFSKITLASRTKSKCDEIATFIKERLGVQIETAQIDADDSNAVVELIKKTGAQFTQCCFALSRFEFNGCLYKSRD